jgi:hypothetical protein
VRVFLVVCLLRSNGVVVSMMLRYSCSGLWSKGDAELRLLA